MLSDIVAQAIVPESDMAIVARTDGETDSLQVLLRRRRIDVIIFGAGDANFSDTAITRLLHTNPRLGLLEIDGAAGEGTLHHLVPARDRIGRLAQSSVAGAIRAGAAFRRR
jgi:hypothetical protein